MKGIIKIIPVTALTEGMQVLFNNKIIILKKNWKPNTNEGDIEAAKNWMNDLKTLVVEYWDDNFDNVRNINSKGLFSIPIRNRQWKSIIDNNLINTTIEFKFVKVNKNPESKDIGLAEIITVAQIITEPKQTYTKQQVEELLKKFAEHVDDLYRPFTRDNVHAFDSLYGQGEYKTSWLKENL
jgi:hypothetical protein